MKIKLIKLFYIVNIIIFFILSLKIISYKYNITNDSYNSKYNLYNMVYKKEKYKGIMLDIPKINLFNEVIKAEDDFSNLDSNLVYYKNFNIENKIVIFGHSGIGYGTYFNRLDELKKGDIMNIYYNSLKYVYTAENMYKINEEDVYILKDEVLSNKILLITCDKFNKKRRLVVEFNRKS